MKFSAALALIVIVGFVASSNALPARKRMVYYQQPAAAEWYGAAPQQRIMYMQYVQPGRTHARSTQAASALVAGESVATGTYVKESDVAAAGPILADDISAESQTAEDILSAAGAHGASSLAEAYPDEAPVVQVSIEAEPALPVSDDEAKVPREVQFAEEEIAEPVAVEEELSEPVVIAVKAELPVPAPIAPVAAILPAKKKIIVELDASPEQDEEAEIAAVEDEEAENTVADDVEEDEEELHVPVKPIVKRRPVAKKPVKAAAPAKKPAAPLPAGTFFPIDFGGTNGGAIAIANAFSTGEGGAATSHAIAYGSPEAARARARPNPSKFRH